MATEIDKRVVEMQFNNKDFEKNCQASLTTLEKLKMALNFDGAKGLESMGKAASKLDLSGIAKGAEAIEVKFNAMNVAGMTVISELTKGFLNLGKTIWNVSFGQMKSGGMARSLKIDQAKFQMKALAGNLEQVKNGALTVQQVMDGMLDSVDRAVTGTAYGYDAAAAVASQLMASGLTDTDKMYNHLRAIAGAASMTGRSFEDIGNIFTTVASNGRLMTMQLRQFSASGLNLSATLAQNLGKTEEEINHMVTKGLIDFDTFSKALSDSFGDAAGKADETWSGVTSNVKAQLSRIGQLFTDPFVEKMIPVFAELKLAIKNLRNVLVPVSKTWDLLFTHITDSAKETLKNLDVARLRSIVNGVENILVAFVEVIYTVKDAFKEVFPPKTLDELHEAAMQFDTMSRQLIPTRETLNGLKEIIKLLLVPLKMIFNIVKSIYGNVIRPLILGLSRILGAILRLGNALKPLADKLTEVLNSSQFLNSVLMLMTATIYVIMSAVIELITVLTDFVSYFVNSTTFNSILEFLSSVGNLIGRVIVTALYLVFTAIRKVMSFISAQNIEKTFVNIRKGLDSVIGIIAFAITTIFNLLRGLAESGTIFGDFIKLLKDISELVKDILTGNDTENRLNNISKTLADLGDRLKDLAKKIADSLKSIDAGKLIIMAFGISLIFLIYAMKNFIEQSTTLVKNVNSFTGIFSGIKKALANVATYNPIMQVLLGMAVAMAAFTSALVTLSRDVEPDRLRDVGIVMGIFAAGMMAFGISMQLLNHYLPGRGNDAGINSLAIQMVAFAASMLILAKAAKEMSKLTIDIQAMGPPLLAISGIMILFAALAKWMNSNSKGSKIFESGGLELIFFAASIKILVSAVNQLGNYDYDSLSRGVVSLMGLMVALGGSISLMGMKLGDKQKGKFAGLFTIGSFILGLIVIVKLIQNLASYPFGEMLNGLKNFAAMLSPIILFLIATAAINTFSIGLIPGLAKMFMALDLSLVLLIGIIQLISNVSKETLGKAMIVVAMFGTFFSKIMSTLFGQLDAIKPDQAFKKTALIKALASFIIAIGVTLSLIALSARIAQGVGIEYIALMALIFSGISVIFKWVIEASANTEKAKVGPMLTLIVGILAIISAIAVLSLINDIGIILSTTFGIAAVLAAFAAAVSVFAKFGPKVTSVSTRADRSYKSTQIIMLAMAGLILAYAGLIYTISKVSLNNTNTIGWVLAGLGGCLVAIGVFIGIASLIKDTKKHNVISNMRQISFMMLALAGTIAIISVAIGALALVTKDIPALRLAGIFGGVIVTFAAISALLVGITKFASKDFSGSDVAKASLAILAASGALVIIASAIGGLAKILTEDDYNKLAGIVAAVTVPLAAMLVALGFILSGLTSRDGFFTDTNSASQSQIMAVANAIVIMSSAFAIIAASIGGLAVLSRFISNDAIFNTLVLFGAFLLSSVALYKSFYKMVELVGKNSLTSGDIISTGAAMVIASSTMAIIASSIALLAISANMIKYDNIGTLYAILGAAILSLIAIVGGLFVLVKFIKRYRLSDYLYAGGAMAIAATSLLLIAESINVISNIEIDDDFNDKVKAFHITIGLIEGLLVILVAVSKSVAGVNILASAGAMAIAASSVLIIAGAIKIIAMSLSEIWEYNEVFKSAIGWLAAISGAITILLGIGVAIGAIATYFGGAGTAKVIYDGMIKIASAFGIFAASVAGLAAAVAVVALAAEILNDTTLDRDRIAKNFEKGFGGIIDGIKNMLPTILEVVAAIIAGIFLIATLNSTKAAYVAVAWVASFLVGLAAAMPAILSAISIITQEILEWIEANPEIANQMKQVGEFLGDAIFSGLEGFLKSALLKHNPLVKAVQTWRDYDTAEYNGWRSDYNQTKDFEKAVEEEVKYLKKTYGYATELTKGVYEQNARSAEEAKEIVDRLLEDMDQMRETKLAMGLDASESSAYRGMMKWATQLGVQKEFLDAYQDRISETTVELDQLNASVEDSSVTVQTLTRDIEDTTEATKEAGNSTSELGDKVSDGLTQAKETLDNFDVTDLIGGIGEQFSGMFDYGFDVNSLKESLKDPMGVVGKFFGGIMGNSAGETAEQTLEYWMEDAMKVIVTNPEEYGKTGHKSGWKYKWQTIQDEAGKQMYKSQAEYANAMLDQANKRSFGGFNLENFLGPLKDIKKEMGLTSDASDNLTKSTNGLSKATVDAAKKFGEFYNSLHDSMSSALKNIYDEYKEDDPIGTDEMLRRMELNTKKVGKWARQLQELAAKGMSEGLLNELKDMGPQAADKVDAFARMTSDQLERANQMFAAKTKLPDYATDNIVDSYKQAGFNASLGFANGVDPVAAEAAFRQLGMDGLAELEKSLDEHSPSKETEKRGLWAVQGFEKGLSSPAAKAMIEKDIQNMSNFVLKRFETYLAPSKMTIIANNLLSGLSKAFNNASITTPMFSSVSRIANSITSIFTSTWKVHSPSRVMEEIGGYLMQGLGIGIDDGSSFVERQTGESADDILQAMRDNLAGKLANVGDDGVYQPVIRPVLDMSEVENGYLMFQNYLNTSGMMGGIDLSGNLSRLTPTSREETDQTQYDILEAVRNINVDGIQSELSNLRNDISELQQAVTGMQVVMDTGALVGQIVDPMDNALGTKALLNGRGRY